VTQAFINRSVAAAADLALFFVGTPDEAMMESLRDVRSNLETQLSEKLGADVAALFAQAFVVAVVGHRGKIEAAGGTSRVAN
jgi:hypothetical protein